MNPLTLLLDSYQSATQGWITHAVEAGMTLFRQLAALELIVFGFLVALKARRGAESVFPDLTWKLFLIAFLLTALLVYPLWVPALAPSFAELAHQITGFSTLDPTAVLAQGIALALLIFSVGFDDGFFGFDIAGAWWSLLAAAGVLFAYIAMAAILARTVIESWIVIAAGPLFLGFAPFRLTTQIADNFVVWAFQVGIKLFFLNLLMAAGSRAALDWAAAIAQARDADFGVYLGVMAGALVLAFVLWSLPTRIADVLTRSWQLGLRQGLSE